MSKILILLALVISASSSSAQDMNIESIPNSELYVSFPDDWTFIRRYLGDGKYRSINVNLPKGDDGGTPMYPEFEFEFLSHSTKDEKLEAISRATLPKVHIGNKDAGEFEDNPEVRYLHGDMSHSYSVLTVTGYVVKMNNGYLICTLTTSSKDKKEHTKYISTLKQYCASAVGSENPGESPNKSSKRDAETGAPS